MHTLLTIGRIVFAIGILALAILGFMYQDFIIGRPPAAQFAVNVGLSYAANSIIVLSCLAILINRQVKAAALIIAVSILLFSISRHLSNSMQDWLNTYKSFALVGGSLIVAASIEENRKRADLFVWGGSILVAIFFVASGYAHFKFAEFVAGFIPSYIPLHNFFAYFTAICLITGGIGLLIPWVRKWAALLSGIMLAGWFLLLHIPRFLADTDNMSDRMGLFESFTFAGIFFVLAAVLSKKRA